MFGVFCLFVCLLNFLLLSGVNTDVGLPQHMCTGQHAGSVSKVGIEAVMFAPAETSASCFLWSPCFVWGG